MVARCSPPPAVEGTAMNDLDVKRVPFMGTELMAAKDSDGQVWAGVRWMCDGLGLSRNQRDNQIEKIKTDSTLSKGAGNFPLPTNGGTQSVLCLKLDYVPLWLAKINITPAMQKETPELAERLEAYQLRAKDVLAEAFLGGKQMFAAPQDYPSALRALADAEEKRMALEAEAKANAPLVLFAKGVEGSSNSILVRDFAKILRQNGILVGGNRLFEWFRENGFLIRQQGRDYNMPTQRSVEMKLFEVKETVISHTTGTQTHRTPLITGKGQTYFYNMLRDWPGLGRQARPV